MPPGIRTLPRLVLVEVPVGDDAHGLATLDCYDAHESLEALVCCMCVFFGKLKAYLDHQEEEVEVEVEAG